MARIDDRVIKSLIDDIAHRVGCLDVVVATLDDNVVGSGLRD
jgi:hypothetical protein